MVDFITVNKWGLPVLDGSFTRGFEFVGDRARLIGGTVSENRLRRKQTYQLQTTLLTAEEAAAVRGLVNGFGNTWDFEGGSDKSSKGHGPEVGGGGTPSVSNGYLGTYGLLMDSGGEWVLKTVVDDIEWTGKWTVLMHCNSFSGFERIVFRDDDAGGAYIDGAWDASSNVSNLVDSSAPETNGFVFKGQRRDTGANVNALYDNISILPYRLTDDMALAFSSTTNTFSLLPDLIVRLADEGATSSAERKMLGDVVSAEYIQAHQGGVWEMAGQRLEITFEESEQVDI